MYGITLRRPREEERLGLKATQMRALIQPPQTMVRLKASVAEMTRVFLEYPVKYLYVTDEAGRFCGAVALKDITSDLLEGHDTQHKSAADYVHTPFPLSRPTCRWAPPLGTFHVLPGRAAAGGGIDAQVPVLAGVVYKTSLLDAYHLLNGNR